MPLRTGTTFVVMKIILMGFWGAFLLFVPNPSSADIYGFVDRNGFWRFQGHKAHPASDYEGIIRRASGEFGVESPLIKAVIKTESDFDSLAVSPKGALGLMQLMPYTAAALKVEDPFDPEENILAGTRYLSLLLGRFRNDWTLALAAYNAGPEMVVTHNGVPPFRETRSYIRKVLKYYEIYLAGE